MKRFLRDEVILTVTAGLLAFWIFSTCTAVTGYTMADRSGRVGGRFSHTYWTRATDAEMRDVWHLPVVLTIVWVPISAWRAWNLRASPPKSPPPGTTPPRRR